MTAAANNVAAVTLAFWIMKICATTAGETGGDLLSMTLGIGTIGSTAVLLTILLILILWALRSNPMEQQNAAE